MKPFRPGGAPLHPALVHFPIAAWTAGLLADMAYLAAPSPLLWGIGYWALAGGTITGLLAMLAGLLDYAAIPARDPAQVPAQAHLVCMGSCWTLFTLDLVLRDPGTLPGFVPAVWLVLLTAVAWSLLLAGGHLGAHLVYHHGIGTAHRDAE